MPNAMSLPVICLQLRRPARRRAGSRRSACRGSPAARRPMAIGTVTTCRMPFGCGSRLRLSLAARARRAPPAGWRRSPPRAASRRRVRARSPRWLVTSSRLAFSCALVAAGDVLHGRRIVGVDRRLQLRRVGDEPRHQRERLRALGAQLIDLRAGRDDLALAACARLRAVTRDVDQVDRDADGQHREQRAREEDPAPQRGQQSHRSVKSSSATPPSGTVIGRGSDDSAFVPGDHAVGARRHVVDAIAAVGVGHREERMAEDEDERVHVRVDVAEDADDARADRSGSTCEWPAA